MQLSRVTCNLLTIASHDCDPRCDVTENSSSSTSSARMKSDTTCGAFCSKYGSISDGALSLSEKREPQRSLKTVNFPSCTVWSRVEISCSWCEVKSWIIVPHHCNKMDMVLFLFSFICSAQCLNFMLFPSEQWEVWDAHIDCWADVLLKWGFF